MTFIPQFWNKKPKTTINIGSLYRIKESARYSYYLHNGNNSTVALKIKENDIVLCVKKHIDTPFIAYKNKIVPGFLFNNVIGTIETKELLEVEFEEVCDDI